MANRSSPKAAPSARPPGASPATAVTLCHGDYAEATVGGVTFNIFDWRVQARTRLINTRAHGERWAQKTPIESEWTFSGQGYVTTASLSHAIAAGFANDGADPPLVTVICYAGNGTATPVFTGTGIMTLGSINAPDSAMATQDIEIEGNGTPTVGV